MNYLLVLGAGGHGKVVAETALASGQWNKIAFLDDRFPDMRQVCGWPVVGRIDDGKNLLREYTQAVVAMGDAYKRLDFLRALGEAGFELPAVVHPTAWVSPSSQLGAGCVVFAQAAVNADTAIDEGVIINTGATVDHDCRLGEGVHVCPGAHIAGGVVIGARSWIGIGACVIQGLRVGADVTVAAGAAVVTDIVDGLTVGGVPASPLRSNPGA